ncbi:hypothetical protein DFH27DRAFT_526607 [Peziza echinospora]|nr:hypothetical protein DFH27DRAFT_526607 [Peziza echinospora]
MGAPPGLAKEEASKLSLSPAKFTQYLLFGNVSFQRNIYRPREKPLSSPVSPTYWLRNTTFDKFTLFKPCSQPCELSKLKPPGYPAGGMTHRKQFLEDGEQSKETEDRGDTRGGTSPTQEKEQIGGPGFFRPRLDYVPTLLGKPKLKLKDIAILAQGRGLTLTTVQICKSILEQDQELTSGDGPKHKEAWVSTYSIRLKICD